VLIRDAVIDSDGKVTKPEVNPWGISFQRMLDMATDSGLFRSQPATPDEAKRLPLYEAKMIHHFDHRWATYVDVDGKAGEVETADLTPTERADPAFTVRPRYWVDEREVLARIARVPSRVARAWLALHEAASRQDAPAADEALASMLLALAGWVAGELFFRAAGEPVGRVWSQQSALPHIEPTERQLRSRFTQLSQVLLGTGLTTKKALVEFPKWASQNLRTRLSSSELDDLAIVLQDGDLIAGIRNLLDTWMDARSPRWLMGWRDICRGTDERTVIASVMPRAGVGNKLPLLLPDMSIGAALSAALLGNLSSLTLDFVARQKLGGTTLNYFYLKQFPVLPPDRYAPTDLKYILPRVLELTYTANDLGSWAEDLGCSTSPFPWDLGRRARLRAELDAYYARLYGLTREELRYVLDPAEVMGTDYPSETFRVLREGELRAHGEFRTQRLVLEAWDRQTQTQGA
jgi:hypothetical protein